MNNIPQQTRKRIAAEIGNLMEYQIPKALTGHAASIIERLRKKALNNKNVAQITIPVKMRVMHDDNGFKFEPYIDCG